MLSDVNLFALLAWKCTAASAPLPTSSPRRCPGLDSSGDSPLPGCDRHTFVYCPRFARSGFIHKRREQSYFSSACTVWNLAPTTVPINVRVCFSTVKIWRWPIPIRSISKRSYLWTRKCIRRCPISLRGVHCPCFTRSGSRCTSTYQMPALHLR
jgi:hypothetical protein